MTGLHGTENFIIMTALNNNKNRIRKFRLEHWQMIAFCMVVYDAIAVNVAYLGALLLRFDLRFSLIDAKYLHAFYRFAPYYTAFCLIIFGILRLYRSIWRFASYNELMRVILSSILTTAFQAVFITTMIQRMPISYYVFGAGIQFFLILSIRFIYRFILLLRGENHKEDAEKHIPNIMIVGAGNAGQIIHRDIRRSPEVNGKVVCYIDDNPNKHGRYVNGVPVVGSREDILQACKKYRIDKIYVAIPSAAEEERRAILNICNETGCELKNLPGIYQIVNGEVSISQMRDVAIEDLLGREQIRVNLDELYQHISGKTILVTGGGGSIGSELCRQIAGHQPKQLIIYDIYENNVYEIQQDLKKKYPDLNLVAIIASVRDSRKLFQVFEEYRPQLVYHAAAHKHVPLMEDSPCEAIKNNAIGTYKTAFAAASHGCERFVLISTDKAVNPTNIMGASKRLCEMIIQAFDSKIKEGKADEIPQLFTHHTRDLVKNPAVINAMKHTKTEFVAVRFGNVLGSNGSVIPLFKKQIAAGGPVTVTHPDIIRYFMTIPEAVSLVLQAGTYAKGGEIFVLDMGEPVKIDDLARNLIKLSGHKPDVDIKIVYTGLRPGEKLYEEKLMAEEGLQKTGNDLIHIGMPIPFDIEVFLGQLEGLMDAAYKNKDDIRERVENVVSTYHPVMNEHLSKNNDEALELAKAI